MWYPFEERDCNYHYINSFPPPSLFIGIEQINLISILLKEETDFIEPQLR